MTRLDLHDTALDAMVKLAEGNLGAANVLTRLLSDGAKIDLDNRLGGLGSLLSLDSLGIYGSRIWMLYKDVCNQSLITTVGVLRGWQLGLISTSSLQQAVDNYGDGLDIEAILAQVKAQLPGFNTEISIDNGS